MTSPRADFFPVRPPEPIQLLRSLKGIFPQFGDEEVVADLQGAFGTGLHCVMRHFTDYFSETHSQSTERQLSALGRLLDDAVTVDDNLENAVATCLLEHLRQINAYKLLSPYLSQRAKEKTIP